MVCKSETTLVFFLLILFFLIYLSSGVGIMNSTDSPQFHLTKNIVEKHTFTINDSPYIAPDYAEVSGKHYSMRSPMESFLAVPFYVIARIVAPYANAPYDGKHVGIDGDSKIEALTLASSSIFGAFAVALLYIFSRFVHSSKWIGLFTSFSYGLGSLHWRYSSSFQRHSLLSFFIIMSLICVYLYAQRGRRIYIILSCLMYGLCISLENTFLLSLPFLTLGLFACYRQKDSFPIRYPLFIGLCFIGLIIPQITTGIYNVLVFHSLFASPFQFARAFPEYTNYSVLFSSPNLSLLVNLINNGPIPLSAISPVLRLGEEVSSHFSANWAIIHTYKGILIQSPYLILSVMGVYVGYRTNRLLVVTTLAILVPLYVAYSKHVGYWSPNSYDTRYFLPVVAALSMFTPFFFKRAARVYKIHILRLLVYLIALVSFSLSVYNGFIANISNYAPHVTGEHRFVLNIGSQPLSEIWINTFPNYKNGLLLSIIFAPLLLVCSFHITRWLRHTHPTCRSDEIK